MSAGRACSPAAPQAATLVPPTAAASPLDIDRLGYGAWNSRLNPCADDGRVLRTTPEAFSPRGIIGPASLCALAARVGPTGTPSALLSAEETLRTELPSTLCVRFKGFKKPSSDEPSVLPWVGGAAIAASALY